MTADDVVAVVRVMVRALAEAGVRLTAEEIAATQLAVARYALPLLDPAEQAQLGRPGDWDVLVRAGRAIPLDDGHYWTGDDHADG